MRAKTFPRVASFIAFAHARNARRVSDVTVRLVQDYPAARSRKVWAGTVRHDLFTVSGLLNFAVDRAYAQENVAKKVKKVKATRNPSRYPSPQELDRVFEAVKKTDCLASVGIGQSLGGG